MYSHMCGLFNDWHVFISYFPGFSVPVIFDTVHFEYNALDFLQDITPGGYSDIFMHT